MRAPSQGRRSPGVMPVPYRAYVQALLDAQPAAEPPATCDACAMCADGAAAPEGARFFDPRTKCCTFHPALPNYLVGRILAGATTPARSALQSAIESGVGVTPLGVAPPRTYPLLYRSAPDAFGRSVTLRCPYYDADNGGRCGIWTHRPAICATWYCKHERGARGLAFWTALEGLLASVEHDLARWCLHQINPGHEAVARLLLRGRGLHGEAPLGAGDLDRTVDASDHRRAWGRFAGREREYFLEAGNLVSRLAASDIRRICGTSIDPHEQLVIRSFRALRSRKLPARLRLGRHQASMIGTASCRVVSYSQFDPLEIPAALLGLLPQFDGRRPTRVVLRAIAARGYRVTAATVQTLADFRVLEEVEGAPDAAGQQVAR